MSLMEVVLAIGVLSFAIPLVLVALGASTQSRRAAADETRSAFLAKEVVAEVGMAWAGLGGLIENSPSYPVFGGDGSELVFACDQNGTWLGRVDSDGYQNGVEDAVFLVRVSGLSFSPDEGISEMSRVRVKVESPARVRAENRRVLEYQTLHARIDG